MTIPSRPLHPIFQLTPGVKIDGRQLGGLSCTSGAIANGISRETLNRKNPSCAAIREATGDTVGGTTLKQNTDVAARYYGVTFELHVGSNVASPRRVAAHLRAGGGVGAQGNTRATLGTKFSSSETAKVNHAAWFNEGRGWHQRNGVWLPDEVLAYDPLADGRRDLDTAPSWWPWSLALEWFAALRPWGDTDSRLLGPGKVYAALGPDTEPHVHLRAGARKTAPFPDRQRANPPAGRRVNVRSGPGTSSGIVDTLTAGTLFVAYQVTDQGQKLDGSSTWYGDHFGSRWVHKSGLAYIGGLS